VPSAAWRARLVAPALAALGVLGFSGTLPATRVAVPALGAVFVGLGRALVAALLAAVFLRARRERFPWALWPRLAVVSLGVVLGFPLCSALALRDVPALHAIVLVGLTPAATAVAAALRARERPGRVFWLGVAVGVASVIGFALIEGAGALQQADLWLVAAVVLVAAGYAEGALLSRVLGGPVVMCWGLILASPVAALILVPGLVLHGLPDAPLPAWIAFAYVSVISMFLGMFAWYEALARGGIARIGQIQLAQPLLGLLWCFLFLGEPLHPAALFSAALVLVAVLLTRLGR
jgi:drug/metabolite transporter (DMT)-like permease